jgi:Tfp pilus assembly protein PilF
MISRSIWMWRFPASAMTLALSACVTPQMHTESQLNEVATRCGLALGELMQDESEKKLLLAIRQTPTVEQRVCVAKWARRNGLKAVFVQMDFPS